jgi:hypothetical protein
MRNRFILPLSLLLLYGGCSKNDAFKVSTDNAGEIKARRINMTGTVKSDFRSKIIERGFCYSADAIPSIKDNKTPDTSNTDNSIRVDLLNLQPNTPYNVVAYAKLNDGTVKMGAVKQITTNSDFEIADVGPGGGFIFNVNTGSNPKFKFAEAKELSNAYSWGCENWNSGAVSYGTKYNAWTADFNTDLINANCATANIASRICSNLVSGDCSDWLLPSGGDLSLIYSLRNTNRIPMTKDSYWSSSEYDAVQGYVISLYDGVWRHMSKSNVNRLIAVRYFNP